jgi:hypothetical protein
MARDDSGWPWREAAMDGRGARLRAALGDGVGVQEREPDLEANEGGGAETPTAWGAGQNSGESDPAKL